MRQVGYIVALEGGVAEIALGEHAQCQRCGACLAAMGKKRRRIKAVNGVGAQIGDKVEVETAPGFAIAAAFLLYICPIIAGFAGGVIGYRIFPAEGWGKVTGAVIMAVVFVAGAVLSLLLLERSYFSRRMPGIISILSSEDRAKGGRNPAIST
jgi:sigma-E factor negative regulatory protein RseC